MDVNELLEMMREAEELFGDKESEAIGELCVAAAYFGKWIVDNNYPMPSNGEEGLALMLKLLMDEEEAFNKVDTWINDHSEIFESMARDRLENKDEEEEESGD